MAVENSMLRFALPNLGLAHVSGSRVTPASSLSGPTTMTPELAPLYDLAMLLKTSPLTLILLIFRSDNARSAGLNLDRYTINFGIRHRACFEANCYPICMLHTMQ
jgi:hypothetical protein